MPRTVTTGLYAFDPTKRNPANRVVNEKQVVTLPGRDDYHFIIPQAAPFFVEGAVVRNETTNETYVEGRDFVFGHWFVDAMNQTGRAVAGSIRFLRRDISGIMVLDYHTLGGPWGFDDQAITRELSNIAVNPLTRSWGQIDVLPELFPPIPHDQKVDSLVGFNDVVAAVGDIVLAIDSASAGSSLSHINDRDNPHDVTKAQVGLGNVANYRTATDAEGRDGNRSDRFMTPRTTREAIEAIALGSLEDHFNDKSNPHQVTKLQVGLGNVGNYPVANTSEAQLLTANNRYITPLRLGDALTRWYDDNLLPLLDGTLENPTNVTKGQIGLGNVQNYQIASATEAVAGVLNTRYMTPLRTRQLVDNFALIPLGNHISDRNNPHFVTKAQVGLGNVENYGIATESQARGGTATNAYMTPALVAHAIRNQAGTDLGDHLNDFGNPHAVTKEQVGLSLVENFRMASRPEAEAGIVTDAYMAPLQVAQAIKVQVRDDFNSHTVNFSNPHNVTAAQVGLGAVDNYRTATDTEARNRERKDRFMTPHATGVALVQFQQDIIDLLTSTDGSPIVVTKDQIGLGQVQNYDMATREEAEAGEIDSAYMSPLSTAQAIQVQVRSDFDTHVGLTNNPHQVTKAQIGLSNVLNYGIATVDQARTGTTTNRYMTPALVAEAITTQLGTTTSTHISDTNNPHNVTKAQIGLGSVFNYGLATKTEAEDGTSSVKYMTPLRTKEAITVQVSALFNPHVNNKSNPHSVTKTQVGLGNVANYPVASEGQARDGLATNAYMTPALTKVVVDKVQADIVALLTDPATSPIAITKEQIGLGQVENFGIASKTQAEEGEISDAYMTPLRTKQAIDVQVKGAINDHVGLTNNPHGVTKAQVGLGNVQNYLIASDLEATAGVRKDRYVTPYLVGVALDKFQDDLITLLTNTDGSPIQVTKEQIGLGNVQNYSIASKIEAEAGTQNERYMTPLRTKQAIDSQVMPSINDHVSATNNPHNVNAVQVGLGDVQNYGIATDSEARAGTRTDRYMTPFLTAEAIDDFQTEFLALFTDPATSPVTISKEQVGLGLVQNYGMALKADAEAGVANDMYMSPLRTKQAIDLQVKPLITAHTSATNNPHNVTANQVGLGAVQNFGLATETDARAVTRNDRYMTPQSVGFALSKFQTDLIALFSDNDTSPITIGKEQIGLGNVQDYGIASKLEAEAGTLNTKYMTPLRTADAIASRLVSVNTKLTAVEAKADSALANKLDRTAAAVDANKVFGKTESELLAQINATAAEDSKRLEGNTLDQVLTLARDQTVSNSLLFDGLTPSEWTSNIQDLAEQTADISETIRTTLLDVTAFNMHPILPFISLPSGFTGSVLVDFVVTYSDGTKGILNVEQSDTTYRGTLLNGKQGDLTIRRRTVSGVQTWYFENNGASIQSILMIEYTRRQFDVMDPTLLLSDGPFTIPSGSALINFTPIPTDMQDALTALEVAFEEAASEL